MSSEIVSQAENPLDALAARITADVALEAKEEEGTPFFRDLMNHVEIHPVEGRKYTAAHLFLRHPERFEIVVHYLARGMGVKRVATLARCHIHTVQAVRDRFPKCVATQKERLADLCGTAATLMVERIIDDPDAIPAQAVGLVAAQLADKMLLLRGGPTVTIEHRHRFTHEDFNRLVEAAPIDVESERMGSSGEKDLLNGVGTLGAGTLGDGDRAPSAEAGAHPPTDSASLDSQSAEPPATRPATPKPPAPGEGGGPENQGGVD